MPRTSGTPPGLLAPVALHIVGPQFFILAPVIVGALVTYRGLSPADANTLAFIEGSAKALATVVLAATVSRINWHRLLRLALVLLVTGNVISAVTDSYSVLVIARTLTGIATGIIVPTAYATIALTERPDRNFGILIATLMAYGAIGFGGASQLAQWGGIEALYGAMAALALLAWPLVAAMPSGPRAEQASSGADAGFPWRWKPAHLLAVGAVFVNFTGFLCFWVNAGLIGARAGIGDAAIGSALALSQLFGIAGALVAGVVGARLGRLLPLTLGIGGQVVAVLWTLLLTTGPDSVAVDAGDFTFAACLFIFSQNLTHPYLLGALASFEKSGRLVAIGASAQMLGVAAGPAVAAMLLADGGNLLTVQIASAGLLATSMMLLLPALMRSARQARLAALQQAG